MRALMVAVSILGMMCGCTKDQPATKSVVAPKASGKDQSPAQPPQHAKVPDSQNAHPELARVPHAAPELPPPAPVVECLKPRVEDIETPIFLKTVVVTRIAKPCVTAQGEAGFEKGTAWMAMGFPCSGGAGRIEWQGHYHTPNTVTFPINNSCPMQPSDMREVAALGMRDVGFDATAPIVAYYPFAVQFWELVGFEDADAGYQVSLRTAHSLKEGWKRYREGKGLPVKLYGRENVWVKGGGMMFAAEGEIVPVTQRTFKLEINTVRALSQEEAETVRSRCKSLVPPRNCHEIFEAAQ